MAFSADKRYKLTIDHTKIDATLKDFPIAIDVATMPGIFSELSDANRKKIKITTDEAGDNQCYVEIEFYDSTNKKGAYHVKVPSISSSSDTVLYVWYESTESDNTSYVGDTGDTAAQNVWDDDFIAVYHFAQDPTGGSGAIKDSTSNGLNGTAGNMESGDLIDGKMGKALEFDGSNEYVSVPYDAKLAPTSELSIEALAYRTDWTETATNEKICSKTEVGGYNVERNQTAGQTRMTVRRNGGYGYGSFANSNLDAGWHYFLGKYDGRYTELLADDGSINGSDDAGGTYPIQYGYSNALIIAGEAGTGGSPTGNYFNGRECELRFSKIARSDAWGKATYYSLMGELVTVAWDESKKFLLSIDSTKISADLTDFPIAVHISSSSGINSKDLTAIFDELGTNKKRLAFFYGGDQFTGAQCYAEVELWDSTGEEAVLHVKVPTVTTEGSKTLVLYYDNLHGDNEGFVGEIGETPAQNVWDDDFVFVHHCNATDPSTLSTVKDSKTGTQAITTTLESDDLVDGLIGKAYDFDNEYLVWPDSDSHTPTGGELTVECFFNTDDNAPTNGDGLVTKYVGSGNHREWCLVIDSAGKLSCTLSPDGSSTGITTVTDPTQLSISTWYYGAATWKGSITTQRLRKDTSQVDENTSAVSSIANKDAGLSLGNNYARDAAYSYDGKMGEARVSKVVRSNAWLDATNYSLKDNLIVFSDAWEEDKRVTLTIDTSKIEADLTGFPLAVSLSASSGINSLDLTRVFDEVGSNKKKIAVFTAPGQLGGEQCFVEVETWDSTGEKAALHVRVPFIGSSQVNRLYLYYLSTHGDNSNFVGDTTETPAQNVWDDDFAAVFHMAQDPTGGSGAIKDSTSGASHGTAVNMESGDLVDGKCGKGLVFDGTNERLEHGNGDGTKITTGDITLEAVVNADVNGGADDWKRIIDRSNGGSGAGGYTLYINDDGTLAFNLAGNSTYTLDIMDPYDEVWCYVAAGADGAQAELQVNDSVNNKSSTNTPGTATCNLYLGDSPSVSPRHFIGTMCEVRISKSFRSVAWRRATYHSLFDSMVHFELPWDESKKYYLVLDQTKVDADLEGFPFVVSLTGTSQEDFFTELDADSKRKKVAFFAGGDQFTGKKCHAEIELFDSTAEKAVYHVRAPEVYADLDTILYLYYDATQPDQDERTGAEASDDFTGENGQPPEPLKWELIGEASYGTIQSNKLDLKIDSTYPDIKYISRDYLSGDFDMQVDFDLTTHPETQWWTLKFAIEFDDGKKYNVDRHYRTDYGNNGYMGWYYNGTTWYPNTQVSRDDLTGKLRMKRVSGNITVYYYNAGWVEICTFGTPNSNDCRFYFRLVCQSSLPTVQLKLDNFIVNADSITGWVGDTGEVPAYNVWDDDFVAVYHLAQDPSLGAGEMKDSTRLALHGGGEGSMTSQDLVDGPVGKAIDFDGSDDRINCYSPADLDNLNPFTIEQIVNADTWGEGGYGRLWDKDERCAHLLNTGAVRMYQEYSGGNITWDTPSSSFALEVWTYVGIAFDASETSNDPSIVIDDAEESLSESAAPSGSPVSDAAHSLYIANRSDAVRSFDGRQSEFRVSKILRTVAWRKTTYYAFLSTLVSIETPPGENTQPNTPTCTVDQIEGDSCRLNGSAFSDPDQGDTHAASQWQVDLSTGDFSSPVHDSGETTTDLTTHDVTGLSAATDYKARVRYKDDSGDPPTEWSEWSTPVPFSTLHKPSTPVISIDDIHKTTCTLLGSTFNDDDGNGHSKSQWQVDLQTEDFSTPEYDSGESTDLTSHGVTGLTGETDYKARVRYKDDSGDPGTEWSEWSNPVNFSTEGDWTGIYYQNYSPANGETQVKEGTPIVVEVMDNWYDFADEDITITVEGVPYDYLDPEVDLTTIDDGVRVTWTPSEEYGRGVEINVRVDAKNENEDESYTEWAFKSFRFVSNRAMESSYTFRILIKIVGELLQNMRQTAQKVTEFSLMFRNESGVNSKGVSAGVLFGIEWARKLIGAGEPTVFVCELKRTFGQGSSNVAEVFTLPGEGSANIYGDYLVITGGSANLQAYAVFVTPGGSGDIVVTLVTTSDGSANIGDPVRITGEGSAEVYKLEQGVLIRINALPSEIKDALEAAGVTING